jgi:hypothetical protein
MRTVHRTMAIVLPVLTLGARQARAQTPNVRISGRIQAHFSTSDGDSTASYNPAAVVNSAFEIRRLRIQADVRIGENVNMVLQPSFEMGALRMRDAYIRVLLWQSPTGGIGLTMGQEKKPFNRYELTSSNTLPSIERGTRIRGLAAVAQNNLLEENGYIAHDLGASADATLLGGRMVLKAGLYNGSGESAVDVNGAKTVAARVIGTVLRDAESRPRLRVGASLISRDRAVTTTAASTTFAPDSSRRTGAWGLEAEWGDFRPGLHVIADLAGGTHLTDAAFRFNTGRNTGNVRPNAPDSAFSTFRSLHVVTSWRWQFDDPSGTRLVKILEPALRVDLTDPDTDRDDDAGLTITPVVNVHFSQTTLMRAGLELYRYRDATGATRSARAFRVAWQAYF